MRKAVGRREKSSPAVLLRMLSEDEELLRLGHKFRFNEPIEDMCSRFSTTSTNADTAFGKMRADLEYREKHQVHELAKVTARSLWPSKIAQTTYNRMMPHGLLGRDSEERPILYKNLGQLNMTKLIASGNDLATVLKYNEWLTERLTQALDYQGMWVVIIDIGGLQLSNVVSLKWVLFVQAMASHDAAHYPDRLHALYMINVPAFFASFWELVARFLDEEARSRIFLIAGEDKWRPILEKALDTSRACSGAHPVQSRSSILLFFSSLLLFFPSSPLPTSLPPP